MSFDEKEARNIIDILLQKDIMKNKRWLNEITKFNSEEIKNLIEGTVDFSYPVSNKESFKKLVYKFNNYSDFILEWYQNKENHKYLIELWKHYVCIEDIKENIKNDEELTKFLESKSIHYSKWPNEIKEQFKSIFDETDGTFIYKIKEELKWNPQIKKIINDLIKNREQCKNIGVNANIKAQRKYEEANDCTLTSIIMGLVSLALPVSGSQGKACINLCKENDLLRQVMNIVCDKGEAKKVANYIYNYMKKNSIICSKWGINNPTCIGINGNLCIEGQYLATSEAQSGTMKIDLSGTNEISAFCSSKIVISVHAGLSLLNLYYSIHEFYQISKIYENIGNYDDELEKIKKSFNDHISEVNLDNDNIDYLIESIKYVRDNIKKDRNKLEELMAKIKTDILKLESKKKKGFAGLAASLVLITSGIAGTMATGGFTSFIYGLSSLSNLISGAKHANNLANCYKYIEELQIIYKKAEALNEEIKKEIDKLELMLKEKEIELPIFYEKVDIIRDKQKKLIKDYF